jgi:hypothetical protein
MTESRDKRTVRIYRTTEKGEHLIRYFHHAEKLLSLD